MATTKLTRAGTAFFWGCGIEKERLGLRPAVLTTHADEKTGSRHSFLLAPQGLCQMEVFLESFLLSSSWRINVLIRQPGSLQLAVHEPLGSTAVDAVFDRGGNSRVRAPPGGIYRISSLGGMPGKS